MPQTSHMISKTMPDTCHERAFCLPLKRHVRPMCMPDVGHTWPSQGKYLAHMRAGVAEIAWSTRGPLLASGWTVYPWATRDPCENVYWVREFCLLLPGDRLGYAGAWFIRHNPAQPGLTRAMPVQIPSPVIYSFYISYTFHTWSSFSLHWFLSGVGSVSNWHRFEVRPHLTSLC